MSLCLAIVGLIVGSKEWLWRKVGKWCFVRRRRRSGIRSCPEDLLQQARTNKPHLPRHRHLRRPCFVLTYTSHSFETVKTVASMISHETLFTLANSLGILAMITVVGYHIVAVNARFIEKVKAQ